MVTQNQRENIIIHQFFQLMNKNFVMFCILVIAIVSVIAIAIVAIVAMYLTFLINITIFVAVLGFALLLSPQLIAY